jgi:plasmid stability protein
MATLVVRKVDDGVVEALKARAKAHGRSAEAEHRAILQDVLAPRWTTRDLIEALQSCSWIGELDADQLRDRGPPREFDYDPEHGTTVR